MSFINYLQCDGSDMKKLIIFKVIFNYAKSVKKYNRQGLICNVIRLKGHNSTLSHQ